MIGLPSTDIPPFPSANTLDVMARTIGPNILNIKAFCDTQSQNTWGNKKKKEILKYSKPEGSF